MKRHIAEAVIVGGFVTIAATIGLGIGVASADNVDQRACTAMSADGWDGTGSAPAPCPAASTPAADGDDTPISKNVVSDTTPMPADQMASLPPVMPE